MQRSADTAPVWSSDRGAHNRAAALLVAKGRAAL